MQRPKSRTVSRPTGCGAKALRFVAEVYHPTRLVGDVTGPLNFAAIGQPPSLTADWTHARIVVSGVPPDPESVSVTLDAPHLDRVGGGGETVFNAKRADLRGHIAEGAPHDHLVVELTLQLAGASAQPCTLCSPNRPKARSTRLSAA